MGFLSAHWGSTLTHRLGGIEAATYPEGVRTATVRVELPESELTADFMNRTQMRASSGVYVPLPRRYRIGQTPDRIFNRPAGKQPEVGVRER